MRKFFTIGLFLMAGISFGQKKIEVRESNENIGGGSHNALSVMIYVQDVDRVEKKWKSKMKGLNGKVSSKKEIFSDDCKAKDMGDNTFDVYARAEEVKGEGVKLIVGVDLGGAFLSSGQHSEQFKFFKKLLHDFAVDVSKDEVSDQLSDQEKVLSKLEGEQKDLEKENKGLKNDIEEYKKKIAKAEEDIKKNEENQKKKKEEIGAQQKVVEKVKEKLSAIK